MTLSAVLSWKNSKAYYHLQNEGYPVFEGRLLGYDGPAALAPPSLILMVKAGDRWISNVDFPGLVECLGNSIEAFRAEGQPG
ncbi:MAG TPA: hypothetical protein VGE66_09520 [Chitinophagaceae bacterium]